MTSPDSITITVAPLSSTADAQGRGTAWPFAYPCGCNLEDGFCGAHGAMMQVIHAKWSDGTSRDLRAIWTHADGYGEPGSVPIQGYDWSGIRDSTPLAIGRMWEAALGLRS